MLRESPVRVSTCLRRRNAGSRWMGWAMIVTSRLVMEGGNIVPYRAAFAGRNRSLDEATKTYWQRATLAIRDQNSDRRQCCEFPVIHGPMRAAPLWRARIGRSVTGFAIATSPPRIRPAPHLSAVQRVAIRPIEAANGARIGD